MGSLSKVFAPKITSVYDWYSSFCVGEQYENSCFQILKASHFLAPTIISTSCAHIYQQTTSKTMATSALQFSRNRGSVSRRKSLLGHLHGQPHGNLLLHHLKSIKICQNSAAAAVGGGSTAPQLHSHLVVDREVVIPLPCKRLQYKNNATHRDALKESPILISMKSLRMSSAAGGKR